MPKRGAKIIKIYYKMIGFWRAPRVSARSFSIARRGSDFTPPPVVPPDTPLWHNVLFSPPGKMTYFSSKLVRAGVLRLTDVINRERFIQQLPMVTKSCYRGGFRRIDQAPRNPLCFSHAQLLVRLGQKTPGTASGYRGEGASKTANRGLGGL